MEYIGFSPYKWQSDALKAACYYAFRGGGGKKIDTVVVKSRRQCGKSVMCENLLLYFAINFHDSISAAVSPTLNQARKLFKDIVNAVWETGVIEKKNESLLEITFRNGSQIFFKSAEQKDGLRGYTLKWGILILDECAYMSDDILELVLPWTQVNKCHILMTSTPKFKTGFFWKYYNMGLDPDIKNVVSFDWSKYDTSALLSKAQLEQYRLALPASQFKSEYLGEFLDDQDSVFKGFRDCVWKPKGNYSSLYLGIDWGTGMGDDYTVLCGLDGNGNQRVFERFNDKSTTEQVKYIKDFIVNNRQKIRRVICEVNGIGRPMTDMLKEKLAGTYNSVEEFNTSNQSKNDIIAKLQVAFEQKKIGILDDDAQLLELNVYSIELSPKTHSVTFNAPQGFHDDTVIALALANKAFSEGNLNNYCIKFA